MALFIPTISIQPTCMLCPSCRNSARVSGRIILQEMLISANWRENAASAFSALSGDPPLIFTFRQHTVFLHHCFTVKVTDAYAARYCPPTYGYGIRKLQIAVLRHMPNSVKRGYWKMTGNIRSIGYPACIANELRSNVQETRANASLK